MFDTLHRLHVTSAATTLALRRAVGFRNVAVHNYGAIDWQVVFAISHQRIDAFRNFAREVAGRFLGPGAAQPDTK